MRRTWATRPRPLSAFVRTDAVIRRENILVGVLLCGAVPLFVAATFYADTWAWLGLKVYVATGGVLGYIFFVRERIARKERWFWRVMARLIPIHVGIMVVFLYPNIRWIDVPISPLVSYFIVFIVTFVELCYFLAAIDRFRPTDQSGKTTP